jgi:Glycosyl transferase family 11
VIIVCLTGGLGNQLFQYAFARYLVKIHGADLWINTGFYANHYNRRRRFELNHFNIFCKQICEDDWRDDKEIAESNFGLRYVRDSELSLENLGRIITLGDNIILAGEWSGYTGHLFEDDFEHLLRRELTLKNRIEDSVFKNFNERIARSGNSVAVHIRRGDYRVNQSYFSLCGEEYYQRAFDLLERKISAPEYFIFSDEIDWVEANFRFSRDVQFVKAGTSISDFELMRRCRHTITANSTYSWWAAYLNENDNKIVIVPKKYYEHQLWQNAHENQTGYGYIPPMWLRL